MASAFTPRATPVVSRRLPVPAGPAPREGGGMGIVSALALEPGSYELRLAAELPGRDVGSVNTFVDIPDFKRERLSMSGILLHVAPEEPSAPESEVTGALPFVPTALRTFTSGSALSAFVQIAQGTTRSDALAAVALRVQVVDTRGAALRDQSLPLPASTFQSNRTANPKVTIPLSGLPSGHYLLRMTAAADERTAERTVRFEIR